MKKKLIYLLFTLSFLSVSCSKEDEPIQENPSVENSDSEVDTPEDKTEVQHVVITAFVDSKFTLPSGTRCEAEFYDASGNILDCEKTLAAASEHSFNIGAKLDKGKQYTYWYETESQEVMNEINNQINKKELYETSDVIFNLGFFESWFC